MFERAVGLYATLINVNAYHQPGVEAGKIAAAEVIALQAEIVKYLGQHPDGASVTEIAVGLRKDGEEETVFKICRHLAANADRGVGQTGGTSPVTVKFKLRS